ncbi:MAG: Spy/CpxP family protein refolding chaperone [Candidatus Latescibacterota bacterium]
MSKRFCLIVTVLLVSLSFAFSGLSYAAPGEAEQPPPPKKVSPADPDTKPPVPARIHECCCRRCCAGKEDKSCKASSKNPHAMPRLGALDGKSFKVEKCMETCGPRGMGSCASSDMDHCGAACMLTHSSVLGLTDKQQDKLKAIDMSTKKKMIDLKATLQKEHLAMQEIMGNENMQATAIKRQLEAVAQAQVGLKYEMILSMIAAKEVLSEEQRELIEEKRHMHGAGCCSGHAEMKMQLHGACDQYMSGDGHKTIEVLVDDEGNECIKVIEIKE